MLDYAGWHKRAVPWRQYVKRAIEYIRETVWMAQTSGEAEQTTRLLSLASHSQSEAA